MQILETGLVIGANRYKIRNMSGAALYLLQENLGTNEQCIGLELKKIDMPYAMFDQLKAKPLPGEYEILVESERGGQDEAKLFAASMRHIEGDQTSLARILQLFGNPPAKAAKPPESPVLLQGSTVGLILSATCYVMEEEGLRGGRVYVGQMSSGRNPDQIGMEVLKFRMPYELFDVLAQKQLPGEYLINLHLERGARDKARYRAVGVQGENLLDRDRLLHLLGHKADKAAKPTPPVPEKAAA